MNVRRARAALHRHHSTTPYVVAVLRGTLHLVLFSALLLSGSSAIAQNTIHVPADQPTIQAGINAAANGDTVLVAPGTYYENIDFKGKAITVTSSGGAAVTIIDGGGIAGVATVTLNSGEARTSVLSKFTIQNGGNATFSSAQNGGLWVGAASPTILNNIIINNGCVNATIRGPTLFQGNTVGAINASSYSNYCSFWGAGLFVGGSGSNNPQIQLDIIGNTIENSRGVVNFGGNGEVFIGNIIRNNIGPEGAVSIANTTNLIFIDNLVYGNQAGGVSQYPQGAGGMTILVPSISSTAYRYYGIIANNTFANNMASPSEYAATQLYLDGDIGSFVVSNNIFYGSGTLPALGCDGGYSYLSGPATFSHNDAFNPSGRSYDSSCGSAGTSNGNVSKDPLFVNAANGNFQLTNSSPLIDTGDNAVIGNLSQYAVSLTTDLAGSPRVQDATGKGCVIDMGAYEYAGTTNDCGVTETLNSSLDPAPLGQSVTFTAQLSAATGVPTGAIQFLDGATILSTQPVSGVGSSAYTTSSLAVGSHTITANYQPAGSFSASTASLTQVVTGYTTSATLSCQPNPIGVFNTALLTATVTSTNGTPTGSISFTDNGPALATQLLQNGTASYTYTGSTAATHTITATYIPTGSFAGSSATCSEVVTPLASTTVLAANPSTVLYGSPVTLTASVSALTQPPAGTPGGMLTFYDGNTAIGSVSLDTFGHANLTATTLAIGTHTLTAVYAGNSVYAASTSNPFTEVIQPPPADFTITLATPSIIIRTQHHTTTTVTFTSLNGFSDSLAISCANLPQYLTCRPTPASVTLAGGSTATVSLYLDTDSVLGYARNVTSPVRARQVSWAWLLAPVSLFGFVLPRRKGRAGIRILLNFLTILPLSLALVGCGELVIPAEIPPSVTPGTYVIPITATGAASGISHTAQLILQVTS